MALTEKQWKTLARDLQRAVARVAPEWSDSNAHDPGVTVLEALIYSITELQYRADALDETARALARAVAERASAVAEPTRSQANDECGPGLQRVNYAVGMVLGVDDFNTEQEYVRERLKQHNRLLHGTGIASGLAVTVGQDAAGSRIAIAPGLALDPSGNEIRVQQPVQVALPPAGSKLLVLLRYVERPCRSVPVVASTCGDGPDGSTDRQPTRIVEAFSAALATVPAADAVAIARLRQVRGRWQIDARFKALSLG